MIQAKISPDKFRISVVLIKEGKAAKFTVDIHSNKYILDLDEKYTEQILSIVKLAVKDNFVFEPEPKDYVKEFEPTLEMANDTLKELDERVNSLIKLSEFNYQTIQDKDSEIASSTERISNLEQILKEKETIVTNLESYIKYADKRISDLTSTLQSQPGNIAQG